MYDGIGYFPGPLRHNGKPLVTGGLWALLFATAKATTINPHWRFFAAGHHGAADGLRGYIAPEASEKMQVAHQ
ncbi:hypothetical protein [Ferruginibacter sp.]|uniref:hypothetical protein n=1 Tax=Ferruginibacter sp. TaxID=1940288 RepID=UPI0026584D8C|nr:hypothetical protein [Ferruginibacter sp.]